MKKIIEFKPKPKSITFVRKSPFGNNMQFSTNKITWFTCTDIQTLNTPVLIFDTDIEIESNMQIILTTHTIVSGNGFTLNIINVKNFKGLFQTNGYKINIYYLNTKIFGSNLKIGEKCGWLISTPESNELSNIRISNCILDAPVQDDNYGFVGTSSNIIHISNCVSYGKISNGTDGFTGYSVNTYPSNVFVTGSYSANGEWSESNVVQAQILDPTVYEKQNMGVLYEKLVLKKFPILEEPLVTKNMSSNIQNQLFITNIIFVDKTIADFDNFFNASNTNTIAIAYSKYSSSYSIVDLIEKIAYEYPNIKRICFAFDNSEYNTKHFVDNAPFFSDSDFESNTQLSTNILLVLWIIKQFKIKHLDWLMCNSLQYDNWTKYYDFIKTHLDPDIIIGASNNRTGNLKYGGDWTLENTNESVQNIYWNNSLDNYSSHLDATTITSSGTIYLRQISTLVEYSLNNTSWTTLQPNDWTVTFINSSSVTMLTIFFNTNITLSSSCVTSPATNAKFIIGSNKILVEGNGKTVTISGVTNYQGLFQNNNSTGYTDIVVQNLSINSSSSTLLGTLGNGCGWFFGTNTSSNYGFMTLSNCSSQCPISNSGGGFFGSNACYNNGTIIVSNCTNSGTIGSYGGGFFGSHSANGSGIITVSDSYNTGQSISSTDNGGIFGYYAGVNSGNISVTNTSNTGSLGNDGGGIFGSYTGINSSTILITNSSNTGSVKTNSGGIVGRYSCSNYSTITVSNCWNSGSLTTQSGGIFGSNNASSGGNTYAIECWNQGSIAQSGGIYGGYSSRNGGTAYASNCSNNQNIGINGGGIFSNFAGDDNSTSQALDCQNSGSIDRFGGGIFASQTTRGYASNCSNSGNIGLEAGGIFGYKSGINNGTCEAIDCFSTGVIGERAGGIFASQTGLNFNGAGPNGYAKATNCYSSGSIETQSGGIYGHYCWNSSATNCYSLGNIGSQSGGIFASSTRNSSAINSYSSGSISSDRGGGIYGFDSQTSTTTNCYSANGNWNGPTASTLLTGTPVYDGTTLVTALGTNWIATSTNNSIPWLFPTFGYSPYTNLKTKTFAQTLRLGIPTSPALNPAGHTYSIVSINDLTPSNFPWITINQSTGSINTTMDGYIGLFRIKVMQNSDYSITNFEMNINVRCFHETTKILCLNTSTNTDEWIEIKNIVEGTLVKTLYHGYKSVLKNKCVRLLNTPHKTKHKLFVMKCNNCKNKDLFQDLYVSGQHSILIDEQNVSDTVKERAIKYKSLKYIDGKIALMAWLNDDFEDVKNTNIYNLYQLVLCSPNVKQQYGIYANGILTESVSIWTGLYS